MSEQEMSYLRRRERFNWLKSRQKKLSMKDIDSHFDNRGIKLKPVEAPKGATKQEAAQHDALQARRLEILQMRVSPNDADKRKYRSPEVQQELASIYDQLKASAY